MHKSAIILGAVALVVGVSAAASAGTATVVTETHIKHNPVPGKDVVDYRVFDANNDGMLTMTEVGEKLFYTFDADGNQLIDNIEWDKPMVMTFAPMEKQTIRSVDFNGDGIADQTTMTNEVFLQQTGLSRFDQHGQGLSAKAFLNDAPYKRTDRDLSGQIDIKEWKEAYISSLRPLPQNDTFRYNE